MEFGAIYTSVASQRPRQSAFIPTISVIITNSIPTSISLLYPKLILSTRFEHTFACYICVCTYGTGGSSPAINLPAARLQLDCAAEARTPDGSGPGAGALLSHLRW